MSDQSVRSPDSLSNDELRQQLQNEFNFECGPITASTRDVYLKKLVKLVDERQRNDGHNGNADHSFNDSHDDHTGKGSALRSSPSRQTRASPRRAAERDVTPTKVKPAPKSRRQSSAAVAANKKTTSTPKSRKTVANFEAFIAPSEPPMGSLANSHPSSLNNYSSESSENEDKNEELVSKVRKSPRKKPSLPPTPKAETPSVSQRVPSARPYLPSRPMSVSSPKPLTISSLARPPLRSPRLSGQLSSKLANYSDSDDTEQEQNNDYIRDRLLRHRPGLSFGSTITTKANPNGIGYEEGNYSSSSNFISFAILVLVVVFFVSIFGIYFYTRISSAPKPTIDLTNFDFVNGEDLVAPICPKTSPDETSPFAENDDCLTYKTDIMPALTIAREIKNFIDQSIVNFYCNSNRTITSFSDFERVPTYMIKNYVRDKIEVVKEGREAVVNQPLDVIFSRDFINALTLIKLNPSWQLAVLSDGIEDNSGITIKEGYPLNLPFTCQAILTMKMNSYPILSAFAVLVVTIGSILFYKRSKKLATEEQDLVYDLVEKSLELIQSPDNPQSMPVLHIRDTLLSPAERKTSKYKKVWNKVVKHIESTESRVKVDIENIEGDDYKTWKWVAANSANNEANLATAPTIRTGSIEWQGQAFNADQSVLALSVPNASNGPNSRPTFAAPTVFLKIRNMFDEEMKLSNPKEWRNEIRSAVLEKVTIASKNGDHGVVHLVVEDSPEGLVYLKCNSIESATEAFNGLHGWWCQKKLVSVKFLKPERYHQRFPDSQHTSTPLTSQ